MSTVFILRAGGGVSGGWQPPGGEDRVSERRERGAWGRAERAGVLRAQKQAARARSSCSRPAPAVFWVLPLGRSGGLKPRGVKREEWFAKLRET